MSRPLISLIIPVYNKKNYLVKSLDSMVNQTYDLLEILLVDDGSTDGSGDICDKYASQYLNVKSLHKENGGPSSAWKYGFKESKGEYIAFADSDDWIDLDMIEKMANHILGDSKEMVLCDHVLEYQDGSSKEVYQLLEPGEYNREAIKRRIIPNLLGSEIRLITLSRCMKLISRELIEENINFCDSDILIGDDSTITLPCLLDADRIFNMKDAAMYHYLYVDDSVVHRYDPNMFDNNRRLYRNYQNTIRAKLKNDVDVCNTLLKAIDREYIFLLLLVIKNEARGNKGNCYKSIQSICSDDEVRKLVATTSIDIKDKSNVLLYMVLQKPSYFRIALLKLAIYIYYRWR